jgi:hypothetical protein
LLAVILLGGPAVGQGSAVSPAPPDGEASTGEAAAAAETPIGTEAFAEEPFVLAPTAPKAFGPASVTFTIATWHIRARTGNGEPSRPAEPVTKWRHTFGAERRTARWREIDKAGFAADIVALQGVKRATDARQLFQARNHHVVVSRQLLVRSAARATGIAVFRDDTPETTALAYRRQRGVTLAGFRHFLPAKGQPRSSAGGREAAAITAFRLRIYGQLLWVASIDLGDDCRESDERPVCRQAFQILRDFTAWVGELRGGAAPLVMLGRWPKAIRVAMEEADLAIVEQPARTRGKCSPEPSGVLLASSASGKAPRVELETKAMPERGNACAHIGTLTIHLEPQDEAESQSAAGTPETLRRVDRR